MTLVRLFVFLIVTISLSCNSKFLDKKSQLEIALSLADENREELEKVLNYYSLDPSDSLKYRAACFLIENMPGLYYYEGEDLDKYGIYYKCLSDRDRTPAEILDSLSTVYGSSKVNNLVVKFDIFEVDSTYLKDNIDISFDIWENSPWKDAVSFDEFCEYILPYRIGNERLTNWKKDYYLQTKYYLDHFLDSLDLEVNDPVMAAKYIREVILKEKGSPRFTLSKPNGYPNVDANVAKYFNGTCDDIVQFTVFSFRSVGIPCTIDYMPMRSYGNASHSWVAIKDSKNHYYTMDFFGTLAFLSDATIHSTSPKSKVYRKTFSRNLAEIKEMYQIEKEVPATFSWSNYRYKDVTMLYSNYLMDVHLSSDFFYEKIDNRLVYFCVPTYLNWVPIDWASVSNSYATFNNINAGGIFRVAIYQDAKLKFVTDPLHIDHQTRQITKYTTDNGNEKEDIVLFTKYPLETKFKERMIGGVFEGSNDISFANADTIHVIKDMPTRLLNEVNLEKGKKYRYVRYKGPSKSNCNVAEVAFYSDTIYLEGNIIGTPGSFNNSKNHLYTNVFDGSTETSFDHNTASEGWSGLDLGYKREITRIIYTPRNRDNFIREEHTYELFMCGKDGWVSMGTRMATSDSLQYEGIPKKALLYLKNHTAGKDEILFLMEEGKQVFKFPNINTRYF